MFLQRDEKVISPSYTRSYPFVMERGEGCYVWDVDGNRYLDFTAGIAVCATGHSHPQVVKAIQDQAERFIHMAATDFYYPLQVEVAEKLTAITPGRKPKRVFLSNSGTEANEAAFKLARYATGRPRILAFLGAFHGRTYGSMSLSASKAIHYKGFSPLVPGVTHTPYAYCYRCPFNLKYPACDYACADYIESTLFKREVPASEVAAIFVEPIQGEGGYIVPPPGWHQRLKQLAEHHKILYVVDEIQSGIGRTGKWFAIEHWGVVPDIVCIAKGVASGMPMGATVADASLMTWESGAHANTFGGNPLACAAALATLRLVEGGLIENAAAMGQRMLDRLGAIQDKHRSMGDVRGKGLMVGVELVQDKTTKEPAPQLRDWIVKETFRRGLLLQGCGANTVRFMPALVVDAESLDTGLQIFEEVLTEGEKAL